MRFGCEYIILTLPSELAVCGSAFCPPPPLKQPPPLTNGSVQAKVRAVCMQPSVSMLALYRNARYAAVGRGPSSNTRPFHIHGRHPHTPPPCTTEMFQNVSEKSPLWNMTLSGIRCADTKTKAPVVYSSGSPLMRRAFSRCGFFYYRREEEKRKIAGLLREVWFEKRLLSPNPHISPAAKKWQMAMSE